MSTTSRIICRPNNNNGAFSTNMRHQRLITCILVASVGAILVFVLFPAGTTIHLRSISLSRGVTDAAILKTHKTIMWIVETVQNLYNRRLAAGVLRDALEASWDAKLRACKQHPNCRIIGSFDRFAAPSWVPYACRTCDPDEEECILFCPEIRHWGMSLPPVDLTPYREWTCLKLPAPKQPPSSSSSSSSTWTTFEDAEFDFKMEDAVPLTNETYTFVQDRGIQISAEIKPPSEKSVTEKN